jgi:hypothetical protein
MDLSMKHKYLPDDVQVRTGVVLVPPSVICVMQLGKKAILVLDNFIWVGWWFVSVAILSLGGFLGIGCTIIELYDRLRCF